MAAPFPLFVIGLIEMCLPEAQGFPLCFIFYTTVKSFGSENFKEISFLSQG
jgi:hypothetical protein